MGILVSPPQKNRLPALSAQAAVLQLQYLTIHILPNSQCCQARCYSGPLPRALLPMPLAGGWQAGRYASNLSGASWQTTNFIGVITRVQHN